MAQERESQRKQYSRKIYLIIRASLTGCQNAAWLEAAVDLLYPVALTYLSFLSSLQCLSDDGWNGAHKDIYLSVRSEQNIFCLLFETAWKIMARSLRRIWMARWAITRPRLFQRCMTDWCAEKKKRASFLLLYGRRMLSLSILGASYAGSSPCIRADSRMSPTSV